MPLIKVKPKKVSFRSKPQLFDAAYSRFIASPSNEILPTQPISDDASNINSTSSFRYDTSGVGLKSTQQIPLDWSDFSQHTFFGSAEANVNVGFNKIINEYPFDGTRQELEEYLDGLTGYERWLLTQFPRSKGFAIFPSGGLTYISVNDFAGTSNLSLSKNITGNKIIDPGNSSFTVEAHIFVTGGANPPRIICQYVKEESSNTFGFTVGLLDNSATTQGTVCFAVSSGTMNMTASAVVEKNVFSHLAFTCDRRPGINRLYIYSGSYLLASSSASSQMGSFNFTTQKFLIASGVSHNVIIPSSTFYGAIDELRFFHDVREPSTLKENAWRNIYPTPELKLYYKFNEPTGSLGSTDNIIIDSSGNSLHTSFTNFVGAVKSTGSYPSPPVRYERLEDNPVLFPSYVDVTALNSRLLTSASLYDRNNPNLITRLIPPHYMDESQNTYGYQEEIGEIGDPYTGSGPPGSGQLGSTHILAALLFVWAKHFDELKIFIDHFSNLLHVDYDDESTVSDQFLPFVFKHWGFSISNLFSNATFKQFFNGEDIGVDSDTALMSLQQVQNAIWRRILVNIGEIVRSKGTIHAIKSFLRSVGINPEKTFKIREYGGSSARTLLLREATNDTLKFLDMSGSFSATTTVDSLGVPTAKPFVKSAYLSGSRYEVGFPTPIGTFVSKSFDSIHGVSDNPSDGLHTSGSWTWLGTYQFPVLSSGSHPLSQSLVRLNSTGSVNAHLMWCNLVALSGSTDSVIKLFARPSLENSGSLLEMHISGVNIYDGNAWTVSFGRQRNDQINSVVSSSWFLRAGRLTDGNRIISVTTASYFSENFPGSLNAMQFATGSWNASGAFFTVGSQSLNVSDAYPFLVNRTQVTSSQARLTNFTGRIGQIRFYSKYQTDSEWFERINNIKTLGVEAPKTNFNFNTQVTGAFERLRLDVSMDQPVTTSTSTGLATLFDFSQNVLHASGTGFEASAAIFKPVIVRSHGISPRFDELAADQKIRIRSLLDDENIAAERSETAPLSQLSRSELPVDDTRFSIDFSTIDALDRDIILIFGALQEIDNALGKMNLTFSDDYPELDVIRDVYFQRLTSKINLRGFFEFFKWFDSSMSLFIEQLLPRKTTYLGTNFIIESHTLERSKVKYFGEDIYLDDTLRRAAQVVDLTEVDNGELDL